MHISVSYIACVSWAVKCKKIVIHNDDDAAAAVEE